MVLHIIGIGAVSRRQGARETDRTSAAALEENIHDALQLLFSRKTSPVLLIPGHFLHFCFNDGDAEIRFNGKMIMNSGIPYVHDPADILVTEAVKAFTPDEAIREVKYFIAGLVRGLLLFPGGLLTFQG